VDATHGPDAEVLAFRAAFDDRSPLDDLVRRGARQMLQAALESEVQAFLEQQAGKVDDQGRRLVVRNGSLPTRQILTGAGPLEVAQPRVRDKSPDASERVRFSSSILPPYLRKSKSLEELIPWLYLKGISTGDFSEALQALVGPEVRGLSANVIVRLKEQWSQEYDVWCRRDLSGTHYVYVWADGIHAKIRLEDEANSRQCLLVLMGATAEGEKELHRRRGWLPGKRAELVGVAAGSQAARIGAAAQAGRRRRRVGLLVRLEEDLPRDEGATLLGPQNGQCAQPPAQERTAQGQGRFA
jgi:putative transposase